MMNGLGIVLALVLAYLLGSFPTSIVVGRLFYGKDPRDFGSGNAGGTNSFRVFGWKAGLAVSALDLGKGLLAVLIAPTIAALVSGALGLEAVAGAQASAELSGEYLRVGAALCAVAGHVWTVFAGFRGGKGVATGAGALFALAPLPCGIAALVFGLVLLTTGIVSASSIAAALSLALASSLLALAGSGPSVAVLILVWILLPLILFTHRANIARLQKGEEKRFERLRLIGRLFDRWKASGRPGR